MTESSLDPMIESVCVSLFLIQQNVVVCCALLGQLVSPLVSPQSSVGSYPSEFHRVSDGIIPDGVDTFSNCFAPDVV